MFILYAIAAGLAIGSLTGGRVAHLAQVRFGWAPLVVLGFLAQVILFTDVVAAGVGGAGPVLYVASTIAVGVAVLRNLDLPGIPLVALGAASNLAAIVSNGGYMPAAPSAIVSVGRSAPVIYSNSTVVARPVLEPLTDQFALPRWLPLANVFSVGDVLIALGVLVLIVVVMRRSAPAEPGGAGRQLPLSS